MDTDRITVTFEFDGNNVDRLRLFLNATVDGMPIGRLIVASGPPQDIVALDRGEITLPELAKKWQPKSKATSGG